MQTDPRSKNKQEWTKVLKKGLTQKIAARLKDEKKDKTKSRFIVNGVFKRKKYFYKEAGHIALQILRIRLNMYATKSNFKANQDNFTCPKCNTHNDSTEHIVECYTDLSSSELKKEDSEHWGKIIKAFKSYTEDEAIIRTAK